MTEFDLIARYFDRPSQTSETVLGNGDDCALLRYPGVLAFSIDTLNVGRHFAADLDPYELGHRALAVNLSDCAAMGARPLAFLLALTLDSIVPEWLEAFSAGLFHLAEEYNIPLIGGNTTQGPLSITIQIIGGLQDQRALRRSAAQAGDDIYVSGVLGGAAFNLASGAPPARLTPRVALGAALIDWAHAAIDLSDGLAQDLNHILIASSCGALLEESALPLALPLQALPFEIAQDYALHGGEDYELCFTAPPAHAEAIQALAPDVLITKIGRILPQRGLWINTARGVETLSPKGFQHFQ